MQVDIQHAAQALTLVLVIGLVQGCASAPQPTAPTLAATATTVPAAATLAPTALPMATPTPAAPVGPTQVAAASPDGHWEGSVSVAGQTIATRLDLKSTGGVLQGTIDFPTQNALNLPLDKVSQQGSQVHIEVLPAPRTAVFDGSLQGEKMSGAFTQAGATGTFQMQRTPVAAAAPLPYKAEDVKFQNGSVTIAGTLTLPATKGPFPAVVLITGSGSQNRDEDIFGFKIFGIIADALTRKGIAVLRDDDRGIGGSSAGSAEDTSETYAGDVAAAVQFLKSRADIDPKQIGLMGHSEGGIIAPMVATRSNDVAFIILMSGPGLPGKEIIMEQVRMIAKANGMSDADVEQNVALQGRVLDAAITGQGWDAVKAELRQKDLAAVAAMSDSQRQALGDVNQAIEKQIDAQVQALTSAWYTNFLTYDPAPALQKVTVPVLALFGGLDTQVPAEPNRVAIMAALDKGGNKDHTAKVFPDANHLYQSAKTGSPDEYTQLKPEFTAGFLDAVSSWILAHVRLTGG